MARTVRTLSIWLCSSSGLLRGYRISAATVTPRWTLVHEAQHLGESARPSCWRALLGGPITRGPIRTDRARSNGTRRSIFIVLDDIGRDRVRVVDFGPPRAGGHPARRPHRRGAGGRGGRGLRLEALPRGLYRVGRTTASWSGLDVGEIIARCRDLGLKAPTDDTTYYLDRMRLMPRGSSPMMR